jgi:hypothetical protein
MAWGAPFQTSASNADDLATLVLAYLDEPDQTRKDQIEVTLRAKAKAVKERGLH